MTVTACHLIFVNPFAHIIYLSNTFTLHFSVSLENQKEEILNSNTSGEKRSDAPSDQSQLYLGYAMVAKIILPCFLVVFMCVKNELTQPYLLLNSIFYLMFGSFL